MTKIKNLYHRKDGRWEYSKNNNNEKIYFIASTKDKVIEKIKNQKLIKRIALKKIETIGTWAKKWIELYKKGNVGKASLDRYQGIINNHIIPFFKDIPLNKITQEQTQKFINLTNTDRNKEYAFLTIKQILKQAYINKKIHENIADTLIKPKKFKKPHRTGLTLNEQNAFINKLKEYDNEVQMFMLFSIVIGSRRAETKKFKFQDISEERNLIHIKGTKTYGAYRVIKISTDFINLLKKHKPNNDDDFYFQKNIDYYTKIAQEIFTACNMKNKVLHDLRHTCATNLYYLEVKDKQRQQILGHASILMTNDIYTNLQQDIDKNGLIKLYNNLYYKY